MVRVRFYTAVKVFIGQCQQDDKLWLTEREGLEIASAEAMTAAIAKRENFILIRFFWKIGEDFLIWVNSEIMRAPNNANLNGSCAFSESLSLFAFICRGWSNWRCRIFSRFKPGRSWRLKRKNQRHFYWVWRFWRCQELVLTGLPRFKKIIAWHFLFLIRTSYWNYILFSASSDFFKLFQAVENHEWWRWIERIVLSR